MYLVLDIEGSNVNGETTSDKRREERPGQKAGLEDT